MPAQAVSQLKLALDRTGDVVSGIKDDQWTAGTPCPAWTVGDLLRHLVAGNYGFAAAVGGLECPAITETDPVDGDLPAAYLESASALLEAFGQPGALERIVTVPIGPVPGIAALHLRITELLTHGWDLARATGQSVEFPDELAEPELEFSRAKLAEIPTDRVPFAPSRPVQAGAPAIERLVALLGRDVTGSGQT